MNYNKKEKKGGGQLRVNWQEGGRWMNECIFCIFVFLYLCQIFSNMRLELGEMSARNFDKLLIRKRELSLNSDSQLIVQLFQN